MLYDASFTFITTELGGCLYRMLAYCGEWLKLLRVSGLQWSAMVCQWSDADHLELELRLLALLIPASAHLSAARRRDFTVAGDNGHPFKGAPLCI